MNRMADEFRANACRIRDAVLMAMNDEAGEICTETGDDAVAADVGVSALMSALASVIDGHVMTAEGRAQVWDMVSSQALDQGCRARGFTPNNRPN